jgi:Rrf2 family protein
VVHVSARAEYALRALLQIAACYPGQVTMSDIVAAQSLPRSYIEAILPELRRADLLRLRRGGHSSYSLARPPEQISVGAVLRAVDGPLTQVRGLPPDEITYAGVARGLSALWLATTKSLERLLNDVTLADVLGNDWPRDAVPLRAVGQRR